MAKRALLVDNEEAILRLLARIFIREGWHVVAVGSGQEAMRAFRAGRFSLVMMDVDLGAGPDGITLAKVLRESEPSLRIVIMSGDLWNVSKVDAAGFGELLLKPFEVAKVTAILRRAA